jgi:hypothetical protein
MRRGVLSSSDSGSTSLDTSIVFYGMPGLSSSTTKLWLAGRFRGGAAKPLKRLLQQQPAAPAKGSKQFLVSRVIRCDERKSN